MSDTNADGIVDVTDFDGDGQADAFAYDTGTGFADGGAQDIFEAPAGFDAANPSGVGTSAGYDLDGDGLLDGFDIDGDGVIDTAGGAGVTGPGGKSYLDDDAYYTQAQQAVGYSASDSSFIEPADAAGSSSLISDAQDPGL